MKKKIAVLLFAVAVLFAPQMAYADPDSSSESEADSSYSAGTCDSHFLAIRAWYDGLTKYNPKTRSCDMLSPQEKFKRPNQEDSLRAYVWTIIMNVVSMVLGIVGYLAIGLVIVGGFQYMLAQGDVTKAARARKTITNSVIGLGIIMTVSIASGAVSDIITQAKNSGGEFFLSIMNSAFVWGGIIAAIMIIWGGIQYMTSAGNPQGITKAKNTILYSAIGLGIVIMAATIVNTVVGAIGQ